MPDSVGVRNRLFHDLLGLAVSLFNNIIGLGICFLHNLMFINQLICLSIGLGQNRIRLLAGFTHNGVTIADDLLILLDFIRNAQTKFYQKLFKFIPVDHNLTVGERLVFAAVNIFFNFTD